MRTLLVAINSKYIHPNLAIRLLKENTDYPVDLREFTVKDDRENIVREINAGGYDCVGISCYIWNVEIVKCILPSLTAPHIILGGPEVSYNAEYYIDNNLAEFVIKNEGEEAFGMLLEAIDGQFQIENVPNLYYKGGYTFDKIADIAKIRPAYSLYDNMEHKIAYIETSRGCPYHCAYCMASLDNRLRFFDMESVKAQILMLKERGAHVFKFLDRTFNANKKFTELIDFIIDNHTPGESYQFEITGDILKPEYIDYINAHAPRGLIRFEIGIQSTNRASNEAVGRIQDNEKLFNNIRRIRDAGVIDMHLDLIAGLPFEDFKSFGKTFNDCIALRPKELQLGFLKLLRGTALYDCIEKYGYEITSSAPYEIISSDFLSRSDIETIHSAENVFDYYYNSGIYSRAMSIILDNEDNPFGFFCELGSIALSGSIEARFRALDEFIKPKNYYREFHEAVIVDYLSHFTVKPRIWWDERIPKSARNDIYKHFCESNPDVKLTDCYKYGMIIDTGISLLIAIYKPNVSIVYDNGDGSLCQENKDILL